ncbi:hypothetical protein LVJ82_16375 [Vitreoscilla massiliensis]|uniref:Uncharacterized protein n=1 Tax=Vitreoscilla massiliensis TaxID=1689272 RepID=A0ABY4E0V5_9NEIS|nr:hypothetical protein [Vitreoscilla massiliensis]UOO89000.1 hypothetical protein LVJ82_16375 [Vitreoscilla massiliensis]
MGVVLITCMVMVYFIEIKWRMKHQKPLNKGNPIDGGQYLVFWIGNSLLIIVLNFVLAISMSPQTAESFFQLMSSIYQIFLADIYYGYSHSEFKIWQDSIPYLTEYITTDTKLSATEKIIELEKINQISQSTHSKNTLVISEQFLSLTEFYQLILVLVTCISLFFGRKFIYAPFFEMTKKDNFHINKKSLILQVFALVLIWLPVIWLVFIVPTHSATCPNRVFSVWCMNLSGTGLRYIAFPTLFLFYWMFILIFINGSISAVRTELGFEKVKRANVVKEN